ncbi:MAG: hypothetical protein PHI12_05815 [Dehalococcoidales bacterium]|nr:hypothetical protein [Dehalococcoidales bacterium]
MPIKYPAAVRKRAIEIAPTCRSAANVIDALSDEYGADQVPMDERTIRRWLQNQNVRYLRNLDEHFAQMTDIANILLEEDVGKVIVRGDSEQSDSTYGINSPDLGYYELTRNQLTGRIEGNIDYVCGKYSTWHMFDCFAEHLMAEFPPEQDYYDLLNKYPGKLINTLRMLAERKTFKGTCPVCKEW